MTRQRSWNYHWWLVAFPAPVIERTDEAMAAEWRPPTQEELWKKVWARE